MGQRKKGKYGYWKKEKRQHDGCCERERNFFNLYKPPPKYTRNYRSYHSRIEEQKAYGVNENCH